MFSFLKWLLLLPIGFGFTILAMLLSPILPLFASKDGWLPNWLFWFQTPDNPLDGDEGFKKEHAPFKGAELPSFEKYINRAVWLFRNPSYGFDLSVLSFNPEIGCDVKVISGKHSLSGSLTEDGWFLATGTNPSGAKAWQFYSTKHWNDTHCVKINIGWKLWSAPSACQFVFSPLNLWKKI